MAPAARGGPGAPAAAAGGVGVGGGGAEAGVPLPGSAARLRPHRQPQAGGAGADLAARDAEDEKYHSSRKGGAPPAHAPLFDPRGHPAKARRRRRALALAAALSVLVALGLTQRKHVPLPWLLAAAAAAYAVWTEGWRVPALRAEAASLRATNRRLVDARRRAGLHRLEADVFRRRREDWPQPPHSGALAALASATDGSRGRFATLSAAPRQRREVDYRKLALACAARIVDERANGAETGDRHAWLFRELSLAGPRPDSDPELYQRLHQAMDAVDAPRNTDVLAGGGVAGPSSSPPSSFYCRLCLGWQKGGARVGTWLTCGHPLCASCVTSLVDAVAGGNVAAPVGCPAGCDACLSPSVARAAYFGVAHAPSPRLPSPRAANGERAPATLGETVPAPSALVHPPSPRRVEAWERFERMHSVRTSLGQSAPKSRGLGAELAAGLKEARRLKSMAEEGPAGAEAASASESVSTMGCGTRPGAARTPLM